ncbi:MAG: xanthine dehydrogenase family protein subunit M [Alphaproteobacteria bacterium]|nr:xanthine dehydrogenase family protein subunit M [Alphaproteobacteria bacterium]
MYEFSYQRPGSLAEAIAAIKSADDGQVLAGGQTLLPTLKQRLAMPSDLIDLAGIGELKGVSVDGGNVVIGAMTRHADVAGSAEIRAKIPALAALADDIGDRQVRNRGTLGGSIANNDPAADYPAACLALGATITTSERKLAAEDFFTGLFETALGDGEIITSVSFPVPDKAAYMKFKNPASRYAIVGVFVVKTGSDVKVAVTGAGSGGVFRVPDMESALAANFSAGTLKDIEVSADGLNSDIHAAADYRAHLIGVMARRAVEACG